TSARRSRRCAIRRAREAWREFYLHSFVAEVAMASAKATTNHHDQIRRSVEARGGYPAHMKTEANRRSPGVLRIDYPGFNGQEMRERIESDEWFDALYKNKLSFLHQDKRNSRFSKLVARRR